MSSQKFDGVVVGVREGVKFTEHGARLNDMTNGVLKKQLDLANKKGKSGESTVVFGSEIYPRIAVVGLGKEEDVDSHSIRLAAGVGVKVLKANGAKTVGVDTTLGNLQATSEGTHLSLYRYHLKKPREEETPVSVGPLFLDGETPEKLEEWKRGEIIAQAQNFARDLADTPANLMTPIRFSQVISEKFASLGETSKVEVIVRDEKWIEEKQMGLLLGVSRGSTEPPRFLEVHYRNSSTENSPPLILVGKGITFDSGGISIKPSANMGNMKGDMTGAASVVSAVYAIAALKLPVHVIALTPLSENMPSGNATKPGDVLTSMSKKTVEVDNTDAEGRLVLADALHYAQTFNPHTLVDVATLTGAISIALGSAAAGAFTPSDALWTDIYEASQKTSEKVWRMPLFKEYRKMMESRVADIINSSTKREAGACTGAAFLQEFVGVDRWLHLDIAGVMQNSEDSAIASRGMSGKPVRTLVELARKYAELKELPVAKQSKKQEK